MEFVSEQQKNIVLDDHRIKLVNGCAGSGKSATLIKCGIHYMSMGKNVIFLTKISSVTDELTKRMKRDYNIHFTKSASHFTGEYNGFSCSVANYDSFIDKQLRKYNIPFEGEAFNQKVRKLGENLKNLNDGLVMKNDQKIDVVLIDEVQDFDKLRVNFTTELFGHFTDLIGVFVGDTLQTVFLQSVMGESFSMNYLKSNLDCKYFELSICYRCPKAHIDFVNVVMKPYREKYCIEQMKSNNHNTIDKPVIFQHHSVHKEYERSDLCERVIYIIDYVLNKDTSISPDDIIVVMNKTNSNAVFEKLLVEVNKYYKTRYNCSNYQHVIHYKTKNHEGRKTIDWSIGEEKTKFISIHGIKGKGHKVIILLGMSEKSIPLVEWLFKTEEIVSQSVMNVALTRSEKYMFVGVNSIPSRYIHDQIDEIETKKLAYCSWNDQTYDTDDTPSFYRELMTGFQKFNSFKFITDKYTKEIVYTPSKSVLAIKEDIVQEYHISDCFDNSFTMTNEEVMKKNKFGKRSNIAYSMNIVERAVLGTMCELLVQRYMRLHFKQLSYENKFLLNYKNSEHPFIYTNHVGLLNLVFDLKLNNYINNATVWHKNFAIIKQKTKHIKSLKELLLSVNKPHFILDNAFQKINLRGLLDEYFSFKPNNFVETKTFWNLSLFYTALSGHYKMVSVMMYINAFNKNIIGLHTNVKDYCEKYLIPNASTHSIEFQKEVRVLRIVKDPTLLQQINPELLKGGTNNNYSYLIDEQQNKENKENEEKEKCKEEDVKPKKEKKNQYTYGIVGYSDVVLENNETKKSILHELKCISCSDPAKVKSWIFQSMLYGYLLRKMNKKKQRDIDEIVITNLLSGTVWRFDMSKAMLKYRDAITFILKEKQFPQVLIDNFLNN